MGRQYFQEALSTVVANGAAISNSTTETILFPNITIPANYMADGRTLRLSAMGKLSNIVTTPGTITFTLRFGGVTGTILAQTSAINLSATAQTDIMFRIMLEIVTRSNGSSGSLLAMGAVYLAQEANVVPADFMGSAGGSTGNTPAAVTVDLTADTALSLTAKFSIANSGNSITGMNEFLESLN